MSTDPGTPAGNERQRRGAAAEALAADLAAAHGLSVIARNFRCRAGELDLVCREGDLLVIIEVRRRTHAGFGGAAGSVGATKQRRIRRATLYFLQRERQWRSLRLRFDVIALSGDADGPPVIDWIRDAFRTG
jgi:putative endonuclease